MLRGSQWLPFFMMGALCRRQHEKNNDLSHDADANNGDG